jgi:hypothetical protein
MQNSGILKNILIGSKIINLVKAIYISLRQYQAMMADLSQLPMYPASS